MHNLQPPPPNSLDLSQTTQPGEVCGGPFATHQLFRTGEGVHYEDQGRTTEGELVVR